MSALTKLGQWVRQRRSPQARFAYALTNGLRQMQCPVIPGLHSGLYSLHVTLRHGWQWLSHFLYWKPLFQSKLTKPAKGLHLYGGMPLVLGPVQITIGDDCRVSGVTTLSGRWASDPAPSLIVGKNCDIGHMNNISVGRRVVLEDNVRMAARCYLAGYPGHPQDAAGRAAGLACKDDQARDIILKQDVWLGTGVFVMAGVTIGEGTIVAAGSVVTKDLPPMVIAGGNPARVIRPLPVASPFKEAAE